MEEKEILEFAQTGAETPKEQSQPEKTNEESKIEIKPYKVFGQDFSVSDPDLIDYYKTRMKMIGVKFKLVGRINEQGQYVIPDAIRYDLVKMEKEIEEAGEDFYKAISLYMQKHFHFHIKIIPIEEGKAKASLFLAEYVQDYLGMEYIFSHVADFVDVYDDEFRIRLRKAFNLVDVATKVDDFAVPELAVVMQNCFDLELVLGGLYDMASQIFVMRLLKALEESGDAGAAVLAKYRELLKGNNIEIDDKFRYTHYKALLDKAIDELGGYEKLGLDPKIINAIVKDMNGTVKAIENASGKGMKELDLPDKKAETKKENKQESKSSSKKPSSDKKADKKPQKKKEEKKKPKKEEKEKTTKGGGVSANSLDKIKYEAPKDEKILVVEITPERHPHKTPPRRSPIAGEVNPDNILEVEPVNDIDDVLDGFDVSDGQENILEAEGEVTTADEEKEILESHTKVEMIIDDGKKITKVELEEVVTIEKDPKASEAVEEEIEL